MHLDEFIKRLVRPQMPLRAIVAEDPGLFMRPENSGEKFGSRTSDGLRRAGLQPLRGYLERHSFQRSSTPIPAGMQAPGDAAQLQQEEEAGHRAPIQEPELLMA